MMRWPWTAVAALVVWALGASVLCGAEATLSVELIAGAKRRNVIFILSDDHRYDALGFLHPFLKTPNLDRIAREGVYFKNAFVTTALCSPSRASILTGLYVHHHGVVDNNNPVKAGQVFFPQYLQKAGYETGFFGKWHMGGESDDPRPGFDKWVSFRGQGTYLPSKSGLNVDGTRVPQKGYITDELTDYCLEWLGGRKGDKPFFVYLSHKAVHAEFVPAERHKGLYADVKIQLPRTYADTPENYAGKPMWVKNQRNSWHGVDFPYHSDLNVAEYYRQYCRTLGAVDDSVGRVLGWLKDKGLEESTLVIYMGDNGFLFGEHGLIDKRNAYEESMRVPLLARCPELFKAGTVMEGMVANIDVAPTVLEAAGLRTPGDMDGRSFLRLATGEMKPGEWRDKLFYEYYWEYNFPHTPSMFAIRGDDYKLIQYHGVWDTDELYDIRNDPQETTNLIRDPRHARTVRRMKQELHRWLTEQKAMSIPFTPKKGDGANLRREGGSTAAKFPRELMRQKNAKE